MVSTLITLLFVALTVYVVVFIVGMLTLPEPARLVVNVIIALVVLSYLARMFGVAV